MKCVEEPKFGLERGDFWWNEEELQLCNTIVSKALEKCTNDADNETIVVILDDRVEEHTRKDIVSKLRFNHLEVKEWFRPSPWSLDPEKSGSFVHYGGVPTKILVTNEVPVLPKKTKCKAIIFFQGPENKTANKEAVLTSRGISQLYWDTVYQVSRKLQSVQGAQVKIEVTFVLHTGVKDEKIESGSKSGLPQRFSWWLRAHELLKIRPDWLKELIPDSGIPFEADGDKQPLKHNFFGPVLSKEETKAVNIVFKLYKKRRDEGTIFKVNPEKGPATYNAMCFKHDRLRYAMPPNLFECLFGDPKKDPKAKTEQPKVKVIKNSVKDRIGENARKKEEVVYSGDDFVPRGKDGKNLKEMLKKSKDETFKPRSEIKVIKEDRNKFKPRSDDKNPFRPRSEVKDDRNPFKPRSEVKDDRNKRRNTSPLRRSRRRSPSPPIRRRRSRSPAPFAAPSVVWVDDRHRRSNRRSSPPRRSLFDSQSRINFDDLITTERRNFNPFEQPQFDRPRFEQPQFDQPHFDRPQFDRPQLDQPQLDQPQFDRPRLMDFERPQMMQHSMRDFESLQHFEQPQHLNPMMNHQRDFERPQMNQGFQSNWESGPPQRDFHPIPPPPRIRTSPPLINDYQGPQRDFPREQIQREFPREQPQRDFQREQPQRDFQREQPTPPQHGLGPATELDTGMRPNNTITWYRQYGLLIRDYTVEPMIKDSE